MKSQLLMGALLLGNFSRSEELPLSMGALGDSMSAGALAQFRRQDAYKFSVQAFIAQTLFRFALSRDWHSIEQRSYSWTTGQDPERRVYSHALRLADLKKIQKITVVDAAVSGAESEDVRRIYLDKFLSESRQRLHQAAPDYVTVFLGANDLCARNENEVRSTRDYYDNIFEIVDTILYRSPRTKLLLVQIPRIDRLHDVAQNASLRFGPLRTCSDVWKRVNLCPTLTTQSDPALRALISHRLVEYNEAMKDVVNSARIYYGDRVRLADQMDQSEISANNISVDCFHPNDIGQNILSDLSWKSTWWAKRP